VTSSRNLRVVLYEPSGKGGVCHYTYALAEHLARAGADVTLMTTEDFELANLERHFRVRYSFRRSWPRRLRDRWGRRRSEGGAPSSSGPAHSSPAGGGLLRRLRLRSLHLAAIVGFLFRRPDVVHLQWLVDLRESRLWMTLLRWMRIPTVYTAHDVEPHRATSAEERTTLQEIYDAATKIIVHTESNRSALLESFPTAPSRIAVIPHGSYDFLQTPEPLTKAAARERIGVPPDRSVILFFGLIKRYKGLEHLVEAFENVRHRSPNAFLLVVGDLFRGDPDGYTFYRSLLERLEGRDDVRCVAQYVPVEDVGLYFAAADVVVLPYVRTTHSGVLLAAYAAARPVVVTDTGGLRESVEEGRSGLVVPPADPPALAEAIVDILGHPDRRDAMGKRARQLAATVYSWDSIASRTIALYRSLRDPILESKRSEVAS
jgi:D-inositol-3-phosphate glycosyltransferase